MSKLIIDNRTVLAMEHVWAHVGAVLVAGKVSNDGRQHAYVTTFGDGVVIYSVLNDKSERLVITRKAAEVGSVSN